MEMVKYIIHKSCVSLYTLTSHFQGLLANMEQEHPSTLKPPWSSSLTILKTFVQCLLDSTTSDVFNTSTLCWPLTAVHTEPQRIPIQWQDRVKADHKSDVRIAARRVVQDGHNQYGWRYSKMDSWFAATSRCSVRQIPFYLADRLTPRMGKYTGRMCLITDYWSVV